jgi:hypothetical protein
MKVVKKPSPSGTIKISLDSPTTLNEREEIFGAQTLNLTPFEVTFAPNSRVHDFSDLLRLSIEPVTPLQ